MNVLIIGSGGREHALALHIAKSSSLKKLYCTPGNPGISQIAEIINFENNNNNLVLEFCLNKKIDLVIIGPEIPLVEGLADFLRKNDVKVFGPNARAALIEGDKSFSKDLMKKYNIPTADYKTFSRNDFDEAVRYIKNGKFPVVIKASGLAAGKGVLICQNLSEAETGLKEIFTDKVFGDAGDQIVIEEFMQGEEASIFAVTDGEKFICLPAAQDHKRVGDNDTGKNTGGMGAYAPAPIITEEVLSKIKKRIISPTLKALKNEGRKFNGCLYAGLMLTEEGPKVVEFNCRFGDPETQVVLPLLDGDFLKLLFSAAVNNLDEGAVTYNGGSSVCVVAASEGYPDIYEKEKEITGIDAIDSGEIIIYHAGTKMKDDKLVTNGGRVLGVTSVIAQNNLKLAKEKAYEAISKVDFKNIYYRKDISDKAYK